MSRGTGAGHGRERLSGSCRSVAMVRSSLTSFWPAWLSPPQLSPTWFGSGRTCTHMGSPGALVSSMKFTRVPCISPAGTGGATPPMVAAWLGMRSRRLSRSAKIMPLFLRPLYQSTVPVWGPVAGSSSTGGFGCFSSLPKSGFATAPLRRFANVGGVGGGGGGGEGGRGTCACIAGN